MEEKGWVSLHRKILNNPTICKDGDYFAVWGYLLLNATHIEKQKIFEGKKITLKKGQLITGRKVIASQFNISESKVQRILKSFEIEHQIEQQTSNKNRLITIVNWEQYQTFEHQIEQQVNNKRTTNEQQVNTNNNDNNVNNVIKKENIKRKSFTKPTLKEVIEYCNERNNNISPTHFIDYYEARGWELTNGKKMKDWKACIRTWESRNYEKEKTPEWYGKEIKQEETLNEEQLRELEEIERIAYRT